MEMLESKGFKPGDIRLLIYDDSSYPTSNNVNAKKKLNWFCSDREKGDVIFMNFSGHGM